MERDNTTGNAPGNAVKAAPPASSARRRLLRGGLGAAPVVLTLASRPVLATTCVTGSSFASANASRPATASAVCSGLGASYWCANPGSWPTTCPNSTTFASVFGTTIFATGTTLLQVLQGGTRVAYAGFPTAAEKTLAVNCVLAWVNFNAGKIGSDVLSTAIIKAAWTNGRSGNFAADAASGIYWTADQVNSWLSQMWV